MPAWSWIPFSAFLILILASGFVGLSDDESYYWVLAQKPALGYAYHPPMVAWMITLSQKIFGGLLGLSPAIQVRMVSCSCMGALFALALNWMARSGGKKERLTLAALTLGSFAGLFGLGWMMVPDVPLFLGWMIAFCSAWKIGFEEESGNLDFAMLALGVCIAVLGKYSGVLVPLSAVLSILAGPFGKKRFLKAFVAATVGTFIALVPIVIWNSQHEWQSILYQVQERHEGSEISFKRYLRFWVIELFAAGPILVFYCFGYGFGWMKKTFARRTEAADGEKLPAIRFIGLWMIPPALIYCLQPLFSDFKPHWAFIVWFPGALALAREVARGPVRFAKAQRIYGLSLVAIVLVSMRIPIMSMAVAHFKKTGYDSRLDVTNDLYGWNRFADFLREHRSSDGKLPYVVASRYQTASQAAVSLGNLDNVTLVPRDLKARDEWPTLPVTKTIGPDWPELSAPVYFVGDGRYDAPPEFKSAKCKELPELDTERDGLLAKRILIWQCNPLNWPE